MSEPDPSQHPEMYFPIPNRAATPLLMRRFLQLLARLFPYRPPLRRAMDTLFTLVPRWQPWDMRVVALLFVCAPLTIWAVHAGLAVLFPPAAAPAGALHHIAAEPLLLWLAAGFLGLVLSAVPLFGVLALVLRREVGDYVHYGNSLYGFDTGRAFVWLAALVSAAALALAWAGAPARLSLFADRLELRRFASGQLESHPYTTVARAEFTTFDGKPYATLAFSDGAAPWSSADGMSLLTLTPAAASFLQTRLPPAARSPAPK